MPKKSCGVRLEDEIILRLERVAKVDRRSLANVIELCIAEYLPQLEADVLKNETLKDHTPPYKTPTKQPLSKPKEKVA